jgi:hypothetical protein
MAGAAGCSLEQLRCAILLVAQQAAAAPPGGGAGPATELDTAQLVSAVQQQPGCSELTEAAIKAALKYAHDWKYVGAVGERGGMLRNITATVRVLALLNGPRRGGLHHASAPRLCLTPRVCAQRKGLAFLARRQARQLAAGGAGPAEPEVRPSLRARMRKQSPSAHPRSGDDPILCSTYRSRCAA